MANKFMKVKSIILYQGLFFLIVTYYS